LELKTNLRITRFGAAGQQAYCRFAIKIHPLAKSALFQKSEQHLLMHYLQVMREFMPSAAVTSDSADVGTCHHQP
jgi:hypothetical protein